MTPTPTEFDTLRALARYWGNKADRLVREPKFGVAVRAAADAEVLTLRKCEKELIEALADIRASR